ncbi:uncharacterized protein ISCGN_002820 [Ixodes scapularis]
MVWVQFCRNRSLQNKTPQQLRERAVCSRHFKPSAFLYRGRLRRDAIPAYLTTEDVGSSLTALTSGTKTSPPTRVHGSCATRTEGKGKMDVLRARLRQLRKHNKRLQQRLQRRRHMLTVTEIVESVRSLVSPAVAALVEAQLKMTNASRTSQRQNRYVRCVAISATTGSVEAGKLEKARQRKPLGGSFTFRFRFSPTPVVCGWLRRREGPRKDAELAEYESRPTIRATGRLPLSTGDAVSAAWCHDRFVAVHVDSKLEVTQFRSGTSRTTFSGASHVEAFRRIQ